MNHDTNNLFKALADPNRRQILRLLSNKEMTAGEISGNFDISSPSMSHHFNILKQSGLVLTRRQGQQIYYSVNMTVFQEMMALFLELLPTGIDEGAQNVNT